MNRQQRRQLARQQPRAGLDLNRTFEAAHARHQAGDLDAAAGLYRQVLAADASHAESLTMLGAITAQSGRQDEAIQLLSRATRAAPNVAQSHFLLGTVLHEAGRSADALAAFDRALALQPNEPVGQHTRASILQALGRRDEAVVGYRRALAIRPDHLPALTDLGTALRAIGDPDAIDVLRRAADLAADDLEASASFVNALQEFGRLAEAEEVSARLVQRHPASARAWAIRAGLKTFAASDPDLARMEALLAGLSGMNDTGPDEEILVFALGKAWMDVGDAQRAFAHLSRGNRLKRATFDYDGRAEVEGLASIPAGLRALTEISVGPGAASELPIFVVGMPRSGTTLVEQILASHADVHGAGELPVFPQVMAEALDAAGLSQRGSKAGRVRVDPRAHFHPARLGRAYLDRVSPLAAGKARLVDKLPGNFANVGLIALTLPGARIVHCVRDPLDTCLSCFATRFAHDQPFAYDLAELGQFYRAYAALMDHWRDLLPPERFLEVRYEDLLADLEGQARRLVAFCGLAWDPACLRFHETRRPVRTASLNQVRRPLYRSSEGRWRAYEAELRPLIQALAG